MEHKKAVSILQGPAGERLGNFKIFLSHATADRDEVLRYASMLEAHGFTAWVYQKDTQPGGDAIPKELMNHIEQCDFFFLFMSDASVKSKWVQAEIGYALSLIDKRQQEDFEQWKRHNPELAEKFEANSGRSRPTDELLPRPIIIPIWVTNSEWRQAKDSDAQRPKFIPTRLSLKGKPTGKFDLTARGFDPTACLTDTDASLIEQLTPRCMFSGCRATYPALWTLKP